MTVPIGMNDENTALIDLKWECTKPGQHEVVGIRICNPQETQCWDESTRVLNETDYCMLEDYKSRIENEIRTAKYVVAFTHYNTFFLSELLDRRVIWFMPEEWEEIVEEGKKTRDSGANEK